MLNPSAGSHTPQWWGGAGLRSGVGVLTVGGSWRCRVPAAGWHAPEARCHPAGIDATVTDGGGSRPQVGGCFANTLEMDVPFLALPTVADEAAPKKDQGEGAAAWLGPGLGQGCWAARHGSSCPHWGLRWAQGPKRSPLSSSHALGLRRYPQPTARLCPAVPPSVVGAGS